MNIVHATTSRNVQAEVRQMQKTIDKVVASKTSAKNFLMKTGMYLPSGQLKKKFR